jgi:FkbM family methyltransferase
MEVLDSLRTPWRRLRTRVRQWQGTELQYPIEVRVPTASLGSINGRWTYCPRGITAASVVYSVGVGSDISFDAALIARENVEIHAFDPTPRSIAWINEQALPDGFHFHPWGLAAHDGTAEFAAPACVDHVSFRIVDTKEHTNTIACPVLRLRTIMERLGHTHVDILKMDIEGAELSVLPQLLESDVNVRQLLVEFHHRGDGVAMNQTKALLRRVHDRGFRIFSVSPTAQEISWIRL